jgi:hypothetical protein
MLGRDGTERETMEKPGPQAGMRIRCPKFVTFSVVLGHPGVNGPRCYLVLREELGISLNWGLLCVSCTWA